MDRGCCFPKRTLDWIGVLDWIGCLSLFDFLLYLIAVQLASLLENLLLPDCPVSADHGTCALVVKTGNWLFHAQVPTHQLNMYQYYGTVQKTGGINY